MNDDTTSQNKSILKHLQSGMPLTALEALYQYGCFRLSARIFDLRAQGHNIKTKIISHNGKNLAQYSMEV